MAFAEIYNKGGTDKTVIINARTRAITPFLAPGWTDLRIAWCLSLTQASADDTITTLTETIGTEPRPLLDSNDRYFIGVIDRVAGLTFAGFTNRGDGGRERTIGSSKLVSSDSGIGTTNSNFWRPKNEVSDIASISIVDRHATRARSVDGSQIHFAQANIGGSGPAGYATVLSIRITRDNPDTRAKIVTVSTKRDVVGHRGDVLFTSTPTEELITANLQAFPTTVQQLGPVELSEELSALYLYWPFRLSRMRVHGWGILKAA